MVKLEYRYIEEKYDAAVAELIRTTLKAHHLDMPGTAYFDESLDHLSEYYKAPDREYYVLCNEGSAVGGVGFAKFEGLEECCEMQKLYLSEPLRGKGTGREMVIFIIGRARDMGYKKMYLETHSRLESAIHLYEKCGFKEIEKPDGAVHGAMDKFYLKQI